MFADLRDSFIRDHVVLGIRDHAMRERFLRVEDLSLEKSIAMLRAAENFQTINYQYQDS